MEAENKCRKKNKNLSSNFYVPPPARKLENIPQLVLNEHKSKGRTLEKIRSENENMKICNNSSLLFKSDETNPRHVHSSQILIKKKKKRKKNKNVKNDCNLDNFLDKSPLIQNAETSSELEAVDCHSVDEEINIFSDLSIGADMNVFRCETHEKCLSTLSKVEDDECFSVETNAINDNQMNDSPNNILDIHSITSSLENSSDYILYNRLTNQINASETLKDIVDVCECRSVYNEDYKGPEAGCKECEQIPVPDTFFEEKLGLTSNTEVIESSALPCKDEVNSELNDDWEKLLDEDDLENFVAKSEISGSITIMKKSHSCYEEKESCGEKDVNDSSIIEIYGFPEEFKTQDLYASFSPYVNRGFQLKWVDTTHALGIFPSPLIADEVLSSGLPFVKTRPLSQATILSKEKAKHLILPSTSRPKTCSALARRLVSGALGVKAIFTPAEIKAEREILKEAREQRRLAAKQRDAAWEGKF